MFRPRPLARALALCALAHALPASAQWQTDGVPVCVAAGDQTKPVCIADGVGGAYIVWEDARGADAQIYAQRLNALGMPQWGANGILVSSGSYPQYGPVAVGDGQGAVDIAWVLSIVPGAYEGRGQRLDRSGVAHWGAGGIAITPGPAFPTTLAIIGDGSTPFSEPSGVILAWTDLRNGVTTDIYIGAVTGNGVQRWNAPVCTAAGNQDALRLVSDGTSNFHGLPQGAILAWRDYRAGPGDPDIYAQRINYAGVAQLGPDGVGVATGTTSVLEPLLVPSGAQNAIACWPGPAAGRTYGLYADRVGGLGTWGAAVPVTTPNSSQSNPSARSDGAGGMIVTWETFGAGLTRDLYAQRVDATGAPLWGAGGQLVCLSPKSEGEPVIVAGRAGGSVIAWIDNRNEGNGDIYVQGIDADGVWQWQIDGLPLCRAIGVQDELSASADTTGGAIVAWTDYRNGNADIYAQRVTGWGGVVGAEPGRVARLALSDPFPNPARAGLTLAVDLPANLDVSAAVYDASGRRVRTLVDGETRPAGRTTLAWDGRGDGGSNLPSGVYWIAIRAGSESGARRAVLLR